MDDIDGVVRQVEVVGVPDDELDGRSVADARSGLVDDFSRRIDPDRATRRHPCGEVEGDRARAAADVDQGQAGPEVPEQVAGGVLAVRQRCDRSTLSWWPWV